MDKGQEKGQGIAKDAVEYSTRKIKGKTVDFVTESLDLEAFSFGVDAFRMACCLIRIERQACVITGFDAEGIPCWFGRQKDVDVAVAATSALAKAMGKE